MSKDTSGPAHPVSAENFRNSQSDTGMTLRQYYAGLAMQGMLAAAENYPTPELALYAFQVADAMIAEGSK